MQKLTAVDIGKQYLDSLKEIGNEWRRSWFRISVTILIEQKKNIGYFLSLSIQGVTRLVDITAGVIS